MDYAEQNKGRFQGAVPPLDTILTSPWYERDDFEKVGLTPLYSYDVSRVRQFPDNKTGLFTDDILTKIGDANKAVCVAKIQQE